jgi:hypothetical protein
MNYKFCSILAASEGEPVEGTAPEKDSAIFFPARKAVWHQTPAKEKLRELSKTSDFGKAISSFKQPLIVYYSPDELTENHIFTSDPSGIKCFSTSGLMVGKDINYIYAICTDGVKDACCAKFGIPVAEAFLKECNTDQFSLSFETSHIGGCRFAATAVCFPSGNSYGRMSSEDAYDIKNFEEKGLIVSKIFRGNIFVSEIHCWIMHHSMENFGYAPTPQQTIVTKEGDRFHVTVLPDQIPEFEFDLIHKEDKFNFFSGCSNIASGRSINRSVYNFVQQYTLQK